MTREQIAREVDFVDYFMQMQFDDYGEETHRAMQEAVNLIKQEPKTGHWIGTEYDGYADGHPVYDVYECSECGMEYDATDDGEITHNYCPNCGAKMEADKEEAEP